MIPDKLDNNASVWLSGLAIFCVCSLSTAAKAQVPNLQSEHASLAVPSAPVNAVTISPPVAPSRQSNSNDKSDSVVFESLKKMVMPGWTADAISIHQTVPRRNTGVANNSQSPDTPSADLPSASGGEPSSLDLNFEFGCTTYAQRVFTQEPSQIVASVYQFSTTEGAYGAYCCLRKGASNLIPKGDASSEDDKSISIWKDKYFVNVSASSSDGSVTLTRIAQQLAASIPSSSNKPRILSQLPSFEKVLGSEKIVMGPLALKKLFPAPYIATLAASADRAHGAIADYQLQEPYRERLKLLVLRFASPALATASFSKYVGQLSEQHDQQDVDGLSYQSSVFKIAGTFMLCQIRNDELVIITGSRKKPSLAALANEIY